MSNKTRIIILFYTNDAKVDVIIRNIINKINKEIGIRNEKSLKIHNWIAFANLICGLVFLFMCV